jgi:hypothetical protein
MLLLADLPEYYQRSDNALMPERLKKYWLKYREERMRDTMLTPQRGATKFPRVMKGSTALAATAQASDSSLRASPDRTTIAPAERRWRSEIRRQLRAERAAVIAARTWPGSGCGPLPQPIVATLDSDPLGCVRLRWVTNAKTSPQFERNVRRMRELGVEFYDAVPPDRLVIFTLPIYETPRVSWPGYTKGRSATRLPVPSA